MAPKSQKRIRTHYLGRLGTE